MASVVHLNIQEHAQAEVFGDSNATPADQAVIANHANDAALNHTLSFAAALSYYFVMAFFPTLIALAAILAYLPIPDLFDTVITTMARVAPPESMGMIRQIVADVILSNRGALLSFPISVDR